VRILEGLRGFVMRWKSMLLAVTTSAALTAASFPAIADDVVIGGGDPDTVAPVFQNVTISQDHVDVSDGPVTLTVTTRITDDKSGFSHGSIGIHEPAGGSGSDYSAYLYSGYRTTGDANDGTYTSTIQVDQYAKPGTYQIYCQAWDLKSNRTTTCPTGLPTVTVTGPGPDTEAPTFQTVTISQDHVDVSDGPVTLTVTTRITDDKSGFSHRLPLQRLPHHRRRQRRHLHQHHPSRPVRQTRHVPDLLPSLGPQEQQNHHLPRRHRRRPARLHPTDHRGVRGGDRDGEHERG